MRLLSLPLPFHDSTAASPPATTIASNSVDRRLHPPTYWKTTMFLDDWTIDRITSLVAQKSRTDQQELLIYIAQKLERTPQDSRKLAMLVKAEKASVKAAQARQQVATLLAAEKRASTQADRKARNHRLMQQGVLFDLAGLENRSRGELLGLLLAAATNEDAQRWATWKARGDALLEKSKQLKAEAPNDIQGVESLHSAQGISYAITETTPSSSLNTLSA